MQSREFQEIAACWQRPIFRRKMPLFPISAKFNAWFFFNLISYILTERIELAIMRKYRRNSSIFHNQRLTRQSSQLIDSSLDNFQKKLLKIIKASCWYIITSRLWARAAGLLLWLGWGAGSLHQGLAGLPLRLILYSQTNIWRSFQHL